MGETPIFPRGDCGEVQGDHRTAKERDVKRNIIWTDVSRLVDGGVGAAAVWLMEVEPPPLWAGPGTDRTYTPQARMSG